jgi:putative ABC transport system permease protein
MGSQLTADVRDAFRALWRQPRFTTLSILTLAAGMAATLALFAIVNAVVFKSLPYPGPETLAAVTPVARAIDGRSRSVVSYQQFLEWRDRNDVFVDVVAWAGARLKLAGSGEDVPAVLTSPGLFSMLRQRPAIGRLLGPADEAPGAAAVAVISYGLWQRAFAGSADVLGASLEHRTGGGLRTIVGVAPRDFKFPLDWDVDCWATIDGAEKPFDDPNNQLLDVVARLRPGVSYAIAQERMSALALHSEHAVYGVETSSVQVLPLRDALIANARPTLLAFFGAVVLLFLIACVNVAHLQLVRANAAQRDNAIRLALGETSWGLMRRVTFEAAIIGLAGGVCGLAAARWILQVFVAANPVEIPRLLEVRVDWVVFAAAGLTSTAAALLCAAFPAWHLATTPVSTALYDVGSSTATTGRGSQRSRAMLVAAEIGLTLVLLVVATLFVNSFVRLTSVDLGFNPASLVGIHIRENTHGSDQQSTDRAVQFRSEMLARLAQMPSVRAAAFGDNLPMAGGAPPMVTVEMSGGRRELVQIFGVSQDYFRTMEIRVLQGRVFSSDDRPARHDVAMVINHTMATRFWPGKNPIGERVVQRRITHIVVGVVADVRQFGPYDPPAPQVYWSRDQFRIPGELINVVIRTVGPPTSVTRDIRMLVESIDPTRSIVGRNEEFDRRLEETFASPRFYTVVSASFAAVALLLALVGVYGVVSYSTLQRVREIGIRMALGASRRGVMLLGVRQIAIPVAAGIAGGLAGAVVMARSFASQLFGISPADGLSLALAAALLAATALFAAWVPLNRIAGTAPLDALRHE